MSAKESDPEDKVEPTVSYLQKLGPEYLDHIFDGSRWVLSVDKRRGFQVWKWHPQHTYTDRYQIFTAENHELPRHEVADFLEEIDPDLSIQYIEYLIDERKETSEDFHDQLAELYLQYALNPKLPEGKSHRRFCRLTEYLILLRCPSHCKRAIYHLFANFRSLSC